MEERVLTTRIILVDHIERLGRSAFILSLDCPYLALVHFTAALESNQVAQRKRVKKCLPKTKLRLRASLLQNAERQMVDAQIGFVSPLEANAIVSIVGDPVVVPRVGDLLEFSLVRDDQ